MLFGGSEKCLYSVCGGGIRSPQLSVSVPAQAPCAPFVSATVLPHHLLFAVRPSSKRTGPGPIHLVPPVPGMAADTQRSLSNRLLARQMQE